MCRDAKRRPAAGGMRAAMAGRSAGAAAGVGLCQADPFQLTMRQMTLVVQGM